MSNKSNKSVSSSKAVKPKIGGKVAELSQKIELTNQFNLFTKGGVFSSFSDSGKTTLAINLIKIVFDEVFAVHCESVDNFQPIKNARVFPSHEVLPSLDYIEDYDEGHSFLDLGASGNKVLLNSIKEQEVDLSFLDYAIVLITAQTSREMETVLSYIKQLLEGGVRKKSLVLIFNMLSLEAVETLQHSMDNMDIQTSFTGLLKGLKELDILPEKPLIIRRNDVFPALKEMGMSIQEFNSDDTDFKLLKKQAKASGNRKDELRYSELIRLRLKAKGVTTSLKEVAKVIIDISGA